MTPRSFLISCFFTSLFIANLTGDIVQNSTSNSPALSTTTTTPTVSTTSTAPVGVPQTTTNASPGGTTGVMQNNPPNGVIQKNAQTNTKSTGKLPPISKKGGGVKKEKIKTPKVELNFGEPTYTFPGFIARVGQRWLGTDYLYNVPKEIGLKIEIEKAPEKDISINTEAILKSVETIFKDMEFHPEAQQTETGPPLPFLHILIFVDQADSRNVAFVSGRLFEGVKLDRINYNPIGTWQAITWEKQELIISSKQQFDEQLKDSVDNIAKTLLQRIKYYEFLKEETEGDVKIYNPDGQVIQHRDAGNPKPVKGS